MRGSNESSAKTLSAIALVLASIAIGAAVTGSSLAFTAWVSSAECDKREAVISERLKNLHTRIEALESSAEQISNEFDDYIVHE